MDYSPLSGYQYLGFAIWDSAAEGSVKAFITFASALVRSIVQGNEDHSHLLVEVPHLSLTVSNSSPCCLEHLVDTEGVQLAVQLLPLDYNLFCLCQLPLQVFILCPQLSICILGHCTTVCCKR